MARKGTAKILMPCRFEPETVLWLREEAERRTVELQRVAGPLARVGPNEVIRAIVEAAHAAQVEAELRGSGLT